MDPTVAFAELSRILLGQTPLNEVLRRVADLAQQTIPGADQVSVTLIEGEKKAQTVAFTGPLAVHLDERQYDLGFGPCMDAATTGQTVHVPNLSSNEAYPDYSRVAVRAGVRSSASIGLAIPQRTVGALNLYDTGGSEIDETSLELARVFAGYASVAVANAAMFTSMTDLSRQMQQAMDFRAVIEQAKGILVARTGATPEQAFTLLSRQSQNTNRKLADVAADLVREASGAGDDVT